MRAIRWFLLSACAVLASPAFANIMDQAPVSSCQVRVHYPASVPGAAEAFILGVGTAMSRSDYDFMAAQMNNKGYVVAIIDHNPGQLVKTDATKYLNCANAVKANLVAWLAPYGLTSVAHWLVGGHSAGGQAAHFAYAANPSLADGVFSIDPYNLSGAPTVLGPALYWGFEGTTCFVSVNDAARAGYYATSGQRALVRVKRVNSFNPCGFSPKFFHCSFADGHCPACTNCMTTPASFFVDVANSVQKFVNAAFYGTWSKANLAVTMTTPTVLFVDGDMP